MEFEWDSAKAESNLVKHGVQFSEAMTVWRDEFRLEILDSAHGHAEERWLHLGFSNKGRVLVVVYCEFDEGHTIRIIRSKSGL
jgi:uncharacterized DUF497 family protein